jgi:hypothetical protein
LSSSDSPLDFLKDDFGFRHTPILVLVSQVTPLMEDVMIFLGPFQYAQAAHAFRLYCIAMIYLLFAT